MITQLNPPLPLDTAKGPGLAHFIIDYGPEADLLWVVFMDKDGACWSVPNPDVRMHFNWSMGRRKSEAETAATPVPLAPADGDGNVTRVFPRKSES
ncbi:MAG: hypothetical protein K9G60_02530 [Pseudolabrys sp.]|nr:hypothetical protein [Pseudolabrys sp.]